MSLYMIRSPIKILEPLESNLLPLTQKTSAVKSKYASFRSVADPGVLALLPCPPPPLPFQLLMTKQDHRSVYFFHQFQVFETEIAPQNSHIHHASDSF